MAAVVYREKCTGCSACMSACPNFAITLKGGKAEVDTELCVSCGTCREICEHGAVILEGGTGGGGY